MSKIKLENCVSMKEASKQTGLSYHALLARIKRNEEYRKKCIKVGWIWLVSKELIKEINEK